MSRVHAVMVAIVLSAGCSKAHPPEQSAAWWCVTTADDSTGICRRARGACEAEHDRLAASGAKPGACAAQPTAFCFVSAPLEGAKRLNCAGSMAVCQRAHEASAHAPGAGKVESDCTEQH